MSRRIKEFVKIDDYTRLDDLIDQLAVIRDSLPANADPSLEMKGDDVFGRRLCISYFRPLTTEEAECDARYSDAYRQSRAPLSGSFIPSACHLRSVAA